MLFRSTLPGQVGTNSLISILVGIATFFTLLKVPAMLLQFAFYSSANAALRKMGGQIINVFSTRKSETEGQQSTSDTRTKKTPRKEVDL